MGKAGLKVSASAAKPTTDAKSAPKGAVTDSKTFRDGLIYLYQRADFKKPTWLCRVKVPNGSGYVNRSTGTGDEHQAFKFADDLYNQLLVKSLTGEAPPAKQMGPAIKSYIERLLQRNGQILPLGTDLPDDFDQWMGIWLPKTKTWAELGIDAAEADYEPSAASHIGSVKPSEYLPFLVAIRKVVEDVSLSLPGRAAGIKAVCSRPEFQEFAERHGGADEIFCYFHPPILTVIPGLTASTRDALIAMGIRTVGAIRLSSDKTLSGVKGLGTAKIAGIRAFCDAYKGDPDAEHLMESE